MTSKLHSENQQDPPDMTKNVTSIKREIFSFIWSINQFGEFLNRKYEFSSPVFSPKTPGTSKWKLVVFPENTYPEGIKVVLRLHKVSTDDRCYSVMYTISLTDSGGKDQQLQTREKVFRYYLDYDECFVASNQKIKDKCLLQNNGTLTVCCKIDLLVCENPDDKISDSVQSCENINVPVRNDLSCMNTYEKSTECEKDINNLSISSNVSGTNTCRKSMEWEKAINDSSEVDKNLLPTPTVKMEYTAYNTKNSKCYKGSKISSDESEKKANGLSEKIDSFINKTRERVKNSHDNRNSKNFKDLEILSDDLSFLYATKYQHDVTILVDDGRIRAHKAILAARSDYFRRILTQSENEIHIGGINIVSLDAVLYYMYTGQSPQMIFDHAMDILMACNMFHLDHLKHMAVNSLKSQINISNVTDILRISKEMKLDNLKICALKFVGKNHEAVTKTEKWNQMISNDPHAAGEILLTIASFQNKPNQIKRMCSEKVENYWDAN